VRTLHIEGRNPSDALVLTLGHRVSTVTMGIGKESERFVPGVVLRYQDEICGDILALLDVMNEHGESPTLHVWDLDKPVAEVLVLLDLKKLAGVEAMLPYFRRRFGDAIPLVPFKRIISVAETECSSMIAEQFLGAFEHYGRYELFVKKDSDAPKRDPLHRRAYDSVVRGPPDLDLR
jgi:hypothetical protein